MGEPATAAAAVGDGGNLKRVNSYQWPAGHVGHLTDGQRGALDRFKKLCEDKAYYEPGDGKDTPPSHDEETMLRYLRARKFIPEEAFKQFKDTEDWRKENQLDKLYETIDVEEYDQTRRLYPQWTGRRDKRGIPLYVFEIGSVDSRAVTAYSNSKDRKKQSTNSKVSWKLLKLFALYENLCRFVLPLCSAMPDRESPETPVSQSNNIVDMHGVGFTKMWNLRNHMSDASNLATAHYPETLDRIFVVGAPSFFPTIWGWAQRWFDPITVSKIFILSQANTKSTLEKYVDIDNIPKKYGGNLDWEFGDMPFLEPEIVKNMRWKEVIEEKGHRTLPKGPIKWQYDEDGDLVATAIGSVGDKPRADVIAGLHPETGIARLALSLGRATNSDLLHSTAANIPPADSSATKLSASNVSDEKPVMGSANNYDDTGKDPHSALPDSSRAGTYTVPYNDESNDISSPPAGGRQGTSSTRFEQQDGTHAQGALAEGTPEVRDGDIGLGDRPAVMDPSTVGQAPKEHAIPGEEPAPSYLDQAKDLAGQAVEQAKQLPQTVMSAVGMGDEKDQETGPEEEAKPEDPKVDAMPGSNVEEFLRNQTMSKHENN